MDTILPIISISELQRNAKTALADVQDYAVIRSHNKDVALVLHPRLGKTLMESPFFRKLLEQVAAVNDEASHTVDMQELDRLIGNVLQELSTR